MNPWLILAVVLAIGAAGLAGYHKGSTDAENRAAAQYGVQLDAKVKEHNENATIDMQAAFEAGKAEAKVRVVTRTITGEANAITVERPIAAVCRLDAPRRLLIDRAIASANSDPDTPGGLPDQLPKDKPAIVK